MMAQDVERNPQKTRRPLVRSAGLRYKKNRQAPKKAQFGTGADEKPSSTPNQKGTEPPQAASLWGGVAKWFGNLKPRMRLAMIAAGSVALVVLLLLILRKVEVIPDLNDHGDEIFPVGQVNSSGELQSYGFGEVDLKCIEKATFKFRYGNGRATVVFFVAGINSKDEVEIQLNGQFVEHAPVTMNLWSDSLRLTLPRKYLKENNENYLSFVNTINRSGSSKTETWGVQVQAVKESPLPSPDRNAAEEAFHIAEDRYKNKDVAPQNLYESMTYLEKARDYLELYPEEARPEIYAEASERINKIEAELEKKRRDLLFSAEQAQGYKRLDQAKEFYHQIMLTFPDPEDNRHREAKEKFEMVKE